jgi:hypothetical protein
LAAFERNVTEDRTARGAWEMLKDARLEREAQRVLWTYAHAPTDYVKEEHLKARRVSRQIKALVRADKIDKDRQGADDPRAALFFDRLLQKYIDVVRSEMPFADNGVTVGDWTLSRSAAGKGMPDLAASRRAFVSLGARGLIGDRKFYLFVLLCYVENAGVRLGLERLTALAHSADPDFQLAPRTLARFLASIPSSFKAKCLRDFRNLPAPPLLPPQD